MPTLIDTRQIRNRAALTNIGTVADETLDNILDQIDTNTSASGTSNAQDRGLKLTDGGTWSWDTSSDKLSLSSTAYVYVPGVEGQRNSIASGDITLTADGYVAYVDIERSGSGSNFLTVNTAACSALTLTDDTFIIARRMGDLVVVGDTFALADGEMLTLDGALAEINRYFGQLQLKEHATNKKRVTVTGADVTKLNGTVLGQTLESMLLSFDGAEIDFSTGIIYEDDGSTLLGDNFTVFDFTGKADHYFYYSVCLIAGDTNADNTLSCKMQVTLATDSNAVKASAPKALFGEGLPLGQIVVQNDSVTSVTAIEDISQSDIVQLGVGAGGGGGAGGVVDGEVDVVSGITGTTVTFNETYRYGKKTGFYRNGVRMRLVDSFSTGSDSYADEYMEVNNGNDSTDITLHSDYPATSDEWFMLELAKATGSVVVANYSRIYADGTDGYQATVTTPSGNTQVNISGWADTAGKLPDYGFSGIWVIVNGQVIERNTTGDGSDTYYTEVTSAGSITGFLFNKDLTNGGIANPEIQIIYFMAQSDINLLNLDSDIVPDADITRTIGSSSKHIKEIYLNQGKAAEADYLIDGMQDFVVPDLADVPHTTITNRAQVNDFSSDLSVHMGTKRILTPELYLKPDEFGPNGEPVYGVTGDKFDQVRFVGTNVLSQSNQYGQYCALREIGQFIEITFYGTGLNLLLSYQGTTNDLRVSIDGGSYGSNIFPTGGSSPIEARSYSPYIAVSVCSGLTEGKHTVVIKSYSTSDSGISGFDIVNESTSLKVMPGNSFVDRSKVTHALESISYNSDFESGTLGTKGGRVLAYLKSDGTVAKAVTPADSTALYMTNADHSNEEVSRKYHWREFGSGRTDDFSTLAGTSDKAFTLSDGMTTLAGEDVENANNNCNIAYSDDFLILTFTGTGIDVVEYCDSFSTSDNYSYYIDGASVGSISGVSTKSGYSIRKIASGLDYTTHIFKILKTSHAAQWIALNSFIVYQPKTPVLPSGASKIFSYNLLADYSFNSSTGIEQVSDGVIANSAARGIVTENGSSSWTAGINIASDKSGFRIINVSGVNTGASIEKEFFGSGIEFSSRLSDNYGKWLIYVDGTLFTSANFPSASANDTSSKFNFTTGELDLYNATNISGYRLAISGLDLGKHTLKIVGNGKNGSSSNYYIVLSEFDIITPIYAPELLEGYQNDSSVGHSLLDERALIPVKNSGIESVASFVAKGIVNAPSTTSTSYVPVPDLHGVIRTKLPYLEINVDMVLSHAGSTNVYLEVFVDGVAIPDQTRTRVASSAYELGSSLYRRVRVEPGVHFVQAFWKVSSGTGYSNGYERSMYVKESR